MSLPVLGLLDSETPEIPELRAVEDLITGAFNAGTVWSVTPCPKSSESSLAYHNCGARALALHTPFAMKAHTVSKSLLPVISAVAAP